jgi:hypothetical protein
MTTPDTIAAQRESLLRQVVFDRPSTVSSDNRKLFSAEIGLTVHAFMADFYAAALAELDPVKADEVAKELAEYLDAGALPVYAWERAVQLGHDPKVWVAEWEVAQQQLAEKVTSEAAEVVAPAGIEALLAAVAEQLPQDDPVKCAETLAGMNRRLADGEA